jgi:LPS-assembly lipoprotein
MSSFDRTARRGALCALTLLPALMLGGCFRPMLADPANGSPGLKDRLASISISPAPDRLTQQVRNKLSFNLTGGGEAPTPRYSLALTTAAIGEQAVVNATTDEPVAAILSVIADFTLTDSETKKILFKAKVNARKAYAAGTQRFAGVRAERDAENDVSETLADQIRLRLAAYLASHS